MGSAAIKTVSDRCSASFAMLKQDLHNNRAKIIKLSLIKTVEFRQTMCIEAHLRL